MIGDVANHLWQSTVFAVAAGLLTVAFRRNQPSVRYWIWFSASLKFLLPFTLLISLGSQVEWAPAAQQIAAPALSSTVVQISQPFVDARPFDVPAAPSMPPRADWIGFTFFAVWICGVGTIAMTRFRGWRRIRAAVHAGTPWATPDLATPRTVQVRKTPGLMEPGVVGVWRPTLLMPADIEEHLTPRQLEAVLAHELCHIRRRDNLTAAIHMIVEAVFWFHPLVWWIGARLVDERERACDEEVLRVVGDPQAYAEGILSVCRRYVETPLVCVSGVSGANLRRRIEGIMLNRIGLRLNVTRKVALALAGVVAFALPVVAGAMNAPPQAAAQSADASGPRFEVASIRPCVPGDAGGVRGGSGASPGRLYVPCLPLRAIIRLAYFGGGQNPRDGDRLSGGPDWIGSERYTIEAIAEGTPPRAVGMGPMLRALLEDRFTLTVRRETREVPVYALVATPGGPALQALTAGDCVSEVTIRPQRPRKPNCDLLSRVGGEGTATAGRLLERGNQAWIDSQGPNRTFDALPIDMDGIAGVLDSLLDRPVVNRTGIDGMFDVHLEFSPDGTTLALDPAVAALDPPSAPSIFTAVQEQLGLKLEPATGPGEFLIIDSVERPTPN